MMAVLSACGATTRQADGERAKAPDNAALGMSSGRNVEAHQFMPGAECKPWTEPPWTPTTLITSEQEYVKLFTCDGPKGPIAPLPSGVDFTRQSIAVFVALALAEEPRFARLVEHEGKYVAVFTAGSYCAGAAPPQISSAVMLLVPAGNRKLDILVYTPPDSSCDDALSP